MPAPRLKPLIHWAIYKGYKVRYTEHSTDLVAGVLTTDTETLEFQYDPAAQLISLPDEQININEHGWEIATNKASSQNESNQETRTE